MANNQQMKMSNHTLLALICLSLFTFAVTPSRADLPPDAQAAVDKGILAAKDAQDYLLAIRYFQDVRKIAPGEPDIYYKLGVAESNIPGRELRAICWLEAYLAVDPTVPNAAAVKKQIDILDVKSQSRASENSSSPCRTRPINFQTALTMIWRWIGTML